MKKIVIALLAIVLAFIGYHVWFSADAKQMRALQAKLDSLAADVQSQDRERILQSMGSLLSEQAEVVLEVRIIAPVGQKLVSAVKQNFDKQGFASFVDNVLYSMREYKLASRVNGRQAPAIMFDSSVSARGMSALLMQQDYQFSGSSTCKALMESATVVKHLDCVLEVR